MEKLIGLPFFSREEEVDNPYGLDAKGKRKLAQMTIAQFQNCGIKPRGPSNRRTSYEPEAADWIKHKYTYCTKFKTWQADQPDDVSSVASDLSQDHSDCDGSSGVSDPNSEFFRELHLAILHAYSTLSTKFQKVLCISGGSGLPKMHFWNVATVLLVVMALWLIPLSFDGDTAFMSDSVTEDVSSCTTQCNNVHSDVNQSAATIANKELSTFEQLTVVAKLTIKKELKKMAITEATKVKNFVMKRAAEWLKKQRVAKKQKASKKKEDNKLAKKEAAKANKAAFTSCKCLTQEDETKVLKKEKEIHEQLENAGVATNKLEELTNRVRSEEKKAKNAIRQNAAERNEMTSGYAAIRRQKKEHAAKQGKKAAEAKTATKANSHLY